MLAIVPTERVEEPEPYAVARSGAHRPTARYGRAMALTAAAYAVLHHLGSLPDGLGTGPSGTRWADWLDLLLPYLVLAPAAATCRAARAPARTWALFGLGAVAYTSGHGIHLAANSIYNTAPGTTAHLWDETVGHYVWYAGVALVTAALATTMRGRLRPSGPVPFALAVAVGVTWATNAIGGGTVMASFAVALAAAAYGWRHRSELPVVLLVAYAPAVVILSLHAVASR
jgi:hypothetical protein